MSLTQALHIVGTQGWFAKRSAEIRKHLASIAKLQRFAKNDLVYLAGDPPNGLFGLVSGSLLVSIPRGDGEDHAIHRASTGFWVGDLALLSQETRLVSIRANEPTVMVHLPAPAIKQLLARTPSLYADFYALSYENSHTVLQITSNLAIASSAKRLADRLLLELDMRGDAEGWIPTSQPELAGLTAMSLPTLRRVLKRFTEDGLISQFYGRIQVVDEKGLRRLCRDGD